MSIKVLKYMYMCMYIHEHKHTHELNTMMEENQLGIV